MNDSKNKEEKNEKPIVRSTRQQGGSTVISLTGLAKEGEFYDIRRLDSNIIVLKRLDLNKVI